MHADEHSHKYTIRTTPTTNNTNTTTNNNKKRINEKNTK